MPILGLSDAAAIPPPPPVLDMFGAVDAAEAAGRFDEAERLLQHALVNEPTSLPMLRRAASIAAQRGSLRTAQTLLHRVLMRDPDDAEAWEIAARLAGFTGDRAGRFEAQGELLRLRPGDTSALYAWLQSAAQVDRLDEACAWVEAMRAERPTDPGFLFATGVAAELRGDLEVALDAYDAAIALHGEPANSDMIVRRALAYARKHSNGESETWLNRGIELAPENASLYQALAAYLVGQARPSEALAAARKAQSLAPPAVNIEANVAVAAVSIGLQDEALAAARRAVAINPNDVTAHRALLGALPYHPGVTGLAMREAGEAAAPCHPRYDGFVFDLEPDPERPLTLGVISGRFCSHPVGWLTVAGFENLDQSRIRTVGFEFDSRRRDMMNARFRAGFGAWRDVSGTTDAELVDRIRSERCDLVIDLSGWGAGGRMHALSNRAAPVQLKWVGSQAHSTGMPTMDWMITDRWETPEGFERFYTERLLRLDDGYVVYAPPAHAPPVVPLPCLASGHVTFGCYNNLAKITHQVLETWARILNRLPGSRLALRTHAFRTAEVCERIRGTFSERGVDPDRIDLLGPLAHEKFLASYGNLDLALDPFPYGGGLSTIEAMWMGVPTIALAGETFAGRHSVSHMSNAGLPDWVASDADAYVELAVARASDPHALAELRSGLRERLRASPVCDGPRFGRSLEKGLRHAWREWCREQEGG